MMMIEIFIVYDIDTLCIQNKDENDELYFGHDHRHDSRDNRATDRHKQF